MKIQKVAFSVLNSKSDNRPQPVGDLSPQEFVSELSKRARFNAQEKDGPGFMVATFRNEPLRRRAEINSVTALVLDCDKGSEFDVVRARLDELKLAYVAYPTINHQKVTTERGDKNGKVERPARDRFRVVVFLTEAVPSTDFDSWYPRAADFVVGPENWDPGAKDASRLSYLPTRSDSSSPGIVAEIGEDRRALDPWRDVPPAYPVPPVVKRSQPQKDLVTPREAYSAHHTLEMLAFRLEAYGYHTPIDDARTGGIRLTRPGKEAREGTSVSIWPGDDRGAIAKVFSSSCEPLVEGRVYDAFGLLVTLDHADDVNAATRAARAWLDERGIEYAKTQEGAQERTSGARKGVESTEERRARAEAFLNERAMTPVELYSLPIKSTEYVVEQLLPSASLCLLAAKPKVGKSTLVRHIALAVATGEDVLGRAVKAGTVVYLSFEEKAGETRDHFQQMGLPEDAPLITVCYPAGDLGLELAEEAIERYNPVLVVVDPIFKLIRVSDTSDYAELTNKLEGLLTLARDSGACILGVHHARKGVANEQDTDAILGSTGLAGAVDNILILGRDGGERTFETIQRYGPDVPRTRLVLGPDRRSLLGNTLASERKSKSEDMLYELIVASPGISLADLKAQADLRNQVRADALKNLERSGRVQRTGRGVKGDPYLYRAVAWPGDDSVFDSDLKGQGTGMQMLSKGFKLVAYGIRALKEPGTGVE